MQAKAKTCESARNFANEYEVHQTLGKGSFGEVFEATCKHNGQRVATKMILLPTCTLDAKQIYRELNILRHLKHRNVVKLADVVLGAKHGTHHHHHDNQPVKVTHIYMSFPKMDTDLAKLIHSNQYLSSAHIEYFTIQLLLAVKHIHSCNVVHRDIKPANILVDQNCSLKLCDFGLARVIPAEEAVALSPARSKCAIGLPPIPSPRSIAAPLTGRSASSRASSFDSTHSNANAENHWEEDDEDNCAYYGEEPSKASVPSVPKKTALNIPRLPLIPTEQTMTPVEKANLAKKCLLTEHVVTRWYRSPEVILLQRYSFAVDIWSVGCVFAELLDMQEGSAVPVSAREAFFPGGHCVPMSPAQSTKHLHSGSGSVDQLSVIFNVLGTPSEADIASVSGGEVRSFLRGLPRQPTANFPQMFPHCNGVSLDLLSKLLQFNPHNRIAIDDAIHHSYLQTIRTHYTEVSLGAGAVAKSPLDVNMAEKQESAENIKQSILYEASMYPTPKF